MKSCSILFARSHAHRVARAAAPMLALTTAFALAACSGDDEPNDPLAGIPAACQQDVVITEPNPNLIWTPLATTLVSEELKPGVFAIYASDAADKGPRGIPLPTSSGFVIGDDGVVVIDTMVNRQLACQVISLVRAQTDKPIRYVVNTSYHGDHIYGNYVFPETAEVVHHAETKAYVEEHFAADQEFMMQNFGQDQGIQEVVPRTADISVSNDGATLDIGGEPIELRYFGFAQTPGDLFVWLPESKVLWTGNPLIAEQPALPWLLDGHLVESTTALRAVRDFLPGDARIVPGHGRPLGVDGFSHSLSYLETLRDEVKDAIDQGLSLEETVATVTMDSFNAYAIFGWVHFEVNVPQAYSELSSNG